MFGLLAVVAPQWALYLVERSLHTPKTPWNRPETLQNRSILVAQELDDRYLSLTGRVYQFVSRLELHSIAAEADILVSRPANAQDCATTLTILKAVKFPSLAYWVREFYSLREHQMLMQEARALRTTLARFAALRGRLPVAV